MTNMYAPATVTDRYRQTRAENRRLRQQLEVYRTHAPDPQTLAQLVEESAANRALYQATLARNVVLARKLAGN